MAREWEEEAMATANEAIFAEAFDNILDFESDSESEDSDSDSDGWDFHTQGFSDEESSDSDSGIPEDEDDERPPVRRRLVFESDSETESAPPYFWYGDDDDEEDDIMEQLKELQRRFHKLVELGANVDHYLMNDEFWENGGEFTFRNPSTVKYLDVFPHERDIFVSKYSGHVKMQRNAKRVLAPSPSFLIVLFVFV